MGASTVVEAYRRYVARRVLVGVILVIVFVLVGFYALTHGGYGATVWEVLKALAGVGGDDKVNLVVWGIRLPRILAAVLVGSALAVAGAVVQALLRNPLATPFTLGVSHGAMFGAYMAILFLGAGYTASSGKVFLGNIYTVMVSAFLGGLAAALAVLTLAKIRGLSPGAIILAGVAMNSLFTSLTILAQYFANEVQLLAMVYWSFGDLGRATWSEVRILFILVTAVIAYFMLRSWDLNAVMAGEDVAKSVGVNVEKMRLLLLFLATLLVSTSVAFVGIIGFVDLLAPHLMRLVIGENYRFLIPLSALTGLVVLLAADTVARLAFSPMVLPVGVVTSFLGAPLFLYLLLKVEGQKWR